MDGKLSDDTKFLVSLGAENARWLYDVRDKLFRFYLVLVTAVIGIIKLGKLTVFDIEFLMLDLAFIGVTYAFGRQILRQRALIDGERKLLRKHLKNVDTPALFYETTGNTIWKSTTFGYLKILLFAFATGVFFLPLPVLAQLSLCAPFRYAIQIVLSIAVLAIGWNYLRRFSTEV